MERERAPIDVGTPSWYDWLEQHSAFLFVDHAGAVTIRKKGTDLGTPEWKASRTRLGKIFTVSLGPSNTISLASLQVAARRLAGKHAQAALSTQPKDRPVASTLPVQKKAVTTDSLRSLMRTKLYRPRSASDIIARDRLIERLNAALACEVTLVCAPAGFGKTTLLAQWVQTIERPNAWLSVDEHDNEMPFFVQSLAASLRTVYPDAFGATATVRKAPRNLSPDEIATVFINDLADMPGDVILILDDYHRIHNRDVHTLLELLIEHQPPQLHIVLTCRSDPPLPVARWLAKGRLYELRGTDLRFTPQETETFLTGILGSEAAREAAGLLDERTEGWIAALRLAALSLRGTADQALFLEQLDSYTARSISSYLVGEILAQQTQEVQEFLERTSILHQFCTELCATIMQSDNSHEHAQDTLDWLDRSNLFLVPLDKRQKWYRFHHLFQELLQQRLQTHCSQQEIASMHLRASTWYASHHLIEEAIRHALLAGDATQATQLVEAQFFQAFEQEQLMQVEHWLRMVPEEYIQASAFLLSARAWISQARGHLKDLPALLTAAEQCLINRNRAASDTDDPSLRLLRGLMETLWSLYYFFTGQAQASLESAHSALALIPPSEEHMISHATFYFVLTNQAAGHEEIAQSTLQHRLQDRSTRLNSTARLLFAQAYAYLAMGKLSQVEHTARHLLRIAHEGELVISQNYAHWLLGLAHYEQNLLDEAAYHFSAVIADQHQAHFWVVRDALCGLALTYQAQGLAMRAKVTALSLLELTQQQHSIAELMVAFSFCGRLALLSNEVEDASRWFEMAGVHKVRGPMFFFEDPPVTEARLLLAIGDQVSIAKAQALLNQLMQLVKDIHNTRKTIMVMALQAWAYDLQGLEAEALDMLESALTLARPGGFMRTFTDFTPLVALLHALRKHRKAVHSVDKNLDDYLQSILALMEQVPAHTEARKDLLVKEGLEQLTKRELQILFWLDSDLTNKEIAHELVVTTETVKLHTKHVYRKLNVNNRRAAVTLARSLGLLTTK